MTLSRVQSVFTYSSASGGQEYLFDIVIDQLGALAVRNIRTPMGLITDSLSQVPASVAQDILDAMDMAQLVAAESSVVSGTETFTGQTSRTVAVAGGTLNNTNYRVQLTSPDGIALRVENKTTTSFDIVASTTYGSVASPKDVDWVIYVSTAQSSTFGGDLSFGPGVTSVAVTFPAAVASADYQVMLQPSDFFWAKVINKAKTGFTVVIGIDPDPNTYTVGYDVVL